MQRAKAFAGFLIVGLIALIGFAAFSATGVGSAPPVDVPEGVTARVSGALLGLDLGPDAADQSLTPLPTEPASTSSGADDGGAEGREGSQGDDTESTGDG